MERRPSLMARYRGPLAYLDPSNGPSNSRVFSAPGPQSALLLETGKHARQLIESRPLEMFSHGPGFFFFYLFEKLSDGEIDSVLDLGGGGGQVFRCHLSWIQEILN